MIFCTKQRGFIWQLFYAKSDTKANLFFKEFPPNGNIGM